MALALHRDGTLVGVDTYDIADDGRILALHRVLNPDKLAHVTLFPEEAVTPGSAVSSP